MSCRTIKSRCVLFQCPAGRSLTGNVLSTAMSVLPPEVKARVAVEAGLRLGWEHYVGLEGIIIGMDGFGASAPAGVLYEKFGITVQAVVDAARSLLKKGKKKSE